MTQPSIAGKARAHRSRILLLLTFFGAGAGVAVALLALEMDIGLAGLIFAVVGIVLATLSLIAAARWWGLADEAVKEAHKTGWYWGGSGGLGLAAGLLGPLLTLQPDVSLRRFALFPGDAGLIATGVALTIGLAFAGYLVGWAGWWILRGR
ncbi:MAG: hypothetical protein GC145_15590 [Caulobacter sp.]|nr:hypothetical protein [Caulobacter sp.]